MTPEDFFQITRTLPDPIYLLDNSGKIVASNLAAAKLLKIDLKTLSGKNLCDFLAQPDNTVKQYLQQSARSREPIPGMLKLQLPDGDQLECHCRSHLLKARSKNSPALILLRGQSRKTSLQGFSSLNEKIEQLTKEVSVRKRIEAEIKELNEELEQRVEQRTQELKEINKDLEDSLQQLHDAQDQLIQSEKMAALGNLVAGIAHEINTPIGVGVTAASYLEAKVKHYQKRYNEDQLTRSDFEKLLNTATESSGIMLTNLKRAAELVQSFKQVAVDQSSSKQRLFNLKEYINDVIISLRPRLKKFQHQIEVDCPEELIVYSYPGVYSQIITNFIMNSLIHGFDGIEAGQISIIVKQELDQLKVTYLDNGNGIATNNVNKIFDPFFTTKRGQGGSGLGLHIIYNLVFQTLNGTITCSSEPGQGLSFFIKVPYTNHEANAVPNQG